MRRTPLQQDLTLLLAASVVLIPLVVIGCAESHTAAVVPAGQPQPAEVATKQDLIARYNREADSVTSINASVTMTLTAGSRYTGVMKQYHEIGGFILAARPASIRVIGQAPVVGTNIFDMVSDGTTFDIFIPSQHKFITGAANLVRPSSKPIENLRPQHLMSAIFWTSIPDHIPVLIEEANDGASRYYVLTVVRQAGGAAASAAGDSADWEIERRVWFDRANLVIARIETYEREGELSSDVWFRDWGLFGSVSYPREIVLSRPDSDYKLQIGIKKATFNEMIAADRFVLEQPAGTELVHAGDGSQSAPATEQEKKN